MWLRYYALYKYHGIAKLLDISTRHSRCGSKNDAGNDYNSGAGNVWVAAMKTIMLVKMRMAVQRQKHDSGNDISGDADCGGDMMTYTTCRSLLGPML